MTDKKITKVTASFDGAPGRVWYCNGITIKSGETVEIRAMPDDCPLSLSEFAARARKVRGMKVEVK